LALLSALYSQAALKVTLPPPKFLLGLVLRGDQPNRRRLAVAPTNVVPERVKIALIYISMAR
jgi:hypothetical protein